MCQHLLACERRHDLGSVMRNQEETLFRQHTELPDAGLLAGPRASTPTSSMASNNAGAVGL